MMPVWEMLEKEQLLRDFKKSYTIWILVMMLFVKMLSRL